MLSDFEFHHIGLAVKDIDITAKLYINAGYNKSDTIYDPIQNVNICFLHKQGMPDLELLAPKDETSPVQKTLEKNGVSPYHFCYKVDNFDIAIAKLREQRYILVKKPENAVAINNKKVCFLYNKDVGLIELLEK